MPILESHRQLINDAIQSLGIDPELCQEASNNKNIWKLHRGQAQIILVLQESTNYKEDVYPTITMMAPIFQIPTDFEEKETLLQWVLEANHKLIAEAFSWSNNWLIISSTYFIDEMRRQEIGQMLDSLSYHAQSFLSTLKERYPDT